MELKEVKRKTKEEIEAAKRRRAKRRAALAVLIVLFIGIIIAGILCFTVLFPIANISVEGNKLYTTEEIIDISEIKAGDKLFSIFSETVNKRLTKGLPYIKNVKLEKHLPDSIKIKVTEAHDTFAFQNGNSYFTADEDFKILKETASRPDNVALIKVADSLKFKCGETLDAEIPSLALANEVYKNLKANNIPVNSIEISAYSAVTAEVCGRFNVQFGSEENLDGKMAHLKTMIAEIDKKNGSTCKGKINLTAWSLQKREGYFELTGNL